MNTRWNDTESNQFIVNEFGSRIGTSAGLSGDDARALGEQVAGRMQSYLPRLGVGSAEGQKVASEFFHEATRSLNNVVGPTRFALGPRPSLIDFCLFTGYYAHQYRDPGEAQRFMKRETPSLCYYLDNLHAAQCAPDEGELEITDELREYLQVIGPPSAGFARGIQKGAEGLASQTELDQVFEETIVDFDFDIMGATFSRSGSTFSAWKLQRVCDVFNILTGDDKECACRVLDDTGWIDILGREQAYRLERIDYQTHITRAK